MVSQLIAGNWKMNGDLHALDIARDIANGLESAVPEGVEVLLCPPAILIHPVASATQTTALLVGGQDCHAEKSGAHTGDISAVMLKSVGCRYVIVGHSERRANHGETSETVRDKAEAAVAAGLTAIVCVGETLVERDDGRALDVIEAQIRASLPTLASSSTTVIAYEPVWAIGTGKTASVDDIADVHSHIRTVLRNMQVTGADDIRLLYGGSVKPENAAEILSVRNVNGALVGGASLKAEDFLAIAAAAPS